MSTTYREEVRQEELSLEARGERLSVVPLEDSACQWDDFVASRAEGTFCHLLGWRGIITDVMGQQCLYRVARNRAGEWRGVLPLVRIRSRVFGHYLVSMPFLNYGGPLGTPAAQRVLAQHASVQAKLCAADLLELRTRHLVDCDLEISRRKVAVVLELAASSEAHRRDVLPPARRRQIRHAQEGGMHTRFGGNQVEPFYEVFRRNMRDLGTPVLPFAWFERVSKTFPHRVIFGVVYGRGDEPIASGCGFVWRDEFELTWLSSLREERHKYAGVLLHWSFMEKMIERGVRTFNFGRCTPGGGPHKFKHQWGGVDVPLSWRRWAKRGLTAPPTPEQPLYRIATAVWRRLPLSVTSRFGPSLAKNLP